MVFQLIEDNSELIKNSTEEQIVRALEAVGLQAVNYVKMLTPVDTGLLKNSIAYAVDGDIPSTGAYRGGKKARTYYDDSGGQATTYDTKTQKSEGLHYVNVGTNVEYAAYVELGISRKKAKPYLKPGIENHANEYRSILEKYLKG